jgi:rRNA maturation endonuclease Nob1
MYSIGKPQGRCVSCYNQFVGPGDRCPACAQKLRQRKRRKRRKRR